MKILVIMPLMLIVALSFVGPLPPSNDYSYFSTLLERTTTRSHPNLECDCCFFDLSPRYYLGIEVWYMVYLTM